MFRIIVCLCKVWCPSWTNRLRQRSPIRLSLWCIWLHVMVLWWTWMGTRRRRPRYNVEDCCYWLNWQWSDCGCELNGSDRWWTGKNNTLSVGLTGIAFHILIKCALSRSCTAIRTHVRNASDISLFWFALFCTTPSGAISRASWNGGKQRAG